MSVSFAWSRPATKSSPNTMKTSHFGYQCRSRTRSEYDRMLVRLPHKQTLASSARVLNGVHVSGGHGRRRVSPFPARIGARIMRRAPTGSMLDLLSLDLLSLGTRAYAACDWFRGRTGELLT